MSRAEAFFYPIYLFLMTIAYLRFFLGMLPGCLAALLLGFFSGRTAGGARKTLEIWGLHPIGVLLGVLLWILLALALSVLLGCRNGWELLFVQKGKVWGGCLAALCFALGHGLSYFEKDKEV